MSACVEGKSNGEVSWKIAHVSLNPQSLFDEFKSILLSVCKPEWVDKPLSVKVFEDGITNKLLGVYVDGSFDRMVLVRLNGNGTEKFIRRDLEVCAMVSLHKAGLIPPIYCQFDNGLCYGYQPGNTLTLDEMADLEMAKRTAKCFAELHHVSIPTQFQCSNRLFEFYGWLDIIEDFGEDKRLKDIFGSKEALVAEAAETRRVIEQINSPLVFSHNDTLSGNIVYNKQTDKVSLIDFEYSGPNIRPFDVANHFCEFTGLDIANVDYSRYPDEEFQKKWIKMYLDEVNVLEGKSDSIVTPDQIHEFYQQVGKCALSSHLLWAIWSLLQAQLSTIDFDYTEYAGIRYAEYLRRKQSFLSL